MLRPIASSKFRRDAKRMERRGKDMRKLVEVLTLLAEERPLAPGFTDHALRGDWAGYRDLHIEPDWLLLYKVAGDELRLARTGTHADLFHE